MAHRKYTYLKWCAFTVILCIKCTLLLDAYILSNILLNLLAEIHPSYAINTDVMKYFDHINVSVAKFWSIKNTSSSQVSQRRHFMGIIVGQPDQAYAFVSVEIYFESSSNNDFRRRHRSETLSNFVNKMVLDMQRTQYMHTHKCNLIFLLSRTDC